MAKSMLSPKDKQLSVFNDENFKEYLEGLVARIEVQAASKGTVWMDELTVYTSQINDMGQKTLMTENAILSTMKQLWAKDGLNPEITTKWDGQFYNWARHVSQRGVEVPTESTLQNRISVYDFYFKNQNETGGFCLPPQLQYELESELEDGSTIVQEIIIDNPNLLQAAYGKLLAAKGHAIKNGGNLSDKLTAMMINNTITFKVFSSQLAIEKAEDKQLLEAELKTGGITDSPPPYQGEDDGTGSLEDSTGETPEDDLVTNGETIPLPETDYTILDDPDSCGIHYQDGAIMGTQNGITVPAFIRATPQDGADHPLVPVIQNYVLSRFGIHDPDLITEMTRTEAPAFVYMEDQKGIVTINGYQFAEVDKDTILALHACISNAMGEILGEEKEGGADTLNEETEG